jgi:hypothetical protein
MAQFTPNTGTLLDAGNDIGTTNSGLSTQIIIKVGSTAVGALQRLSVAQARPLERIKEIGTDGVIEIVPNGPTTFELTATRIVFDQIRLPEAFLRGFRFINAQRIPFDIEVLDLSGIKTVGALNLTTPSGTDGIVSMTYKNCWFASYTTPYAADTYLISEEATIWCETAYVTDPKTSPNYDANGPRALRAQTDSAAIETTVNQGARRGSMDVSGLLNSVFRT